MVIFDCQNIPFIIHVFSSKFNGEFEFQHFNTNKPLEKSIFNFFVQRPLKFPKSKIFVYFASLVYLGRTGALEMPKMSHVIDKTGVCKLHAAIWDFFIFRSIRADFRSNSKYPPDKKFMSKKTTLFLRAYINNMTHRNSSLHI